MSKLASGDVKAMSENVNVNVTCYLSYNYDQKVLILTECRFRSSNMMVRQ